MGTSWCGRALRSAKRGTERMRRFVRIALLVSVFAALGDVPAFGQAVADQPQPVRIDITTPVAEAAQLFGIPEAWIWAVMRTESAGRIGAVSSAGALGLMQLMPATWARQRARLGLGEDPFDPRDNIAAGTSYLRELYDRYGPSGFLAAYNAGPGRYEDWRDRGRPLPAETLDYVARIAPGLADLPAPVLQSASTPAVAVSALPVQPARISWTQGGLFAARPKQPDGASGSSAALAPSQLASSPRTPLNGVFAPVSGDRSR